VDQRFKKVHLPLFVGSTCQELCDTENFKRITRELLRDFEQLDRALNQYLDRKRSKFARLFFTSNDELIEIMGSLDSSAYLQKFLGKLFEGIDEIKVNENKEIESIQGKTGEVIQLR
jgi:dynein heavy chain